MTGRNAADGGPELDARVPQAEIPQVYDRLAGVYDIWGWLTESRARARALELAAIKDGMAIMEVAVGTGLAFHEIVKSNPHGQNLGIDLSAGMLKKARSRLAKLPGASYRLEVGTAFDLPPPSDSIDILVNNYMFDLIPYADMDRILGEFRRVLKTDGRLILVNMTRGRSRASRIYEGIYRISPRTMGGCRGVQMVDRLRQHGFAVELTEYHQQFLFPSEVIVARNTPRAPIRPSQEPSHAN
jgi:ubiquinone/menaquinone biosynthesis C-methylase UbiE